MSSLWVERLQITVGVTFIIGLVLLIEMLSA